MNSLVIYYSQYGNTKRVAEAIADVLRLKGSVRLRSLKDLTESDFDGVDLAVAGSPTYRMNLPEEVRQAFDGLPRRLLYQTPCAVFDTSYEMSPWLAPFTASKKLAGRLRRLGGKRIPPPSVI